MLNINKHKELNEFTDIAQISPAQASSSGPDGIITDEDIIRDWGVSLSFINQHSSEMKPFRWRPRRYFRKFVEEFFLNRAAAGQKKTKYTRMLALRDFEDAKARMHKQSKHNGGRHSGERRNITQRAKHE
ncbi:MAG: hypothetical protein M0Z61_09580 [Nitrospiraceae bacterium]|nr:hypothetical protein [Nitrospiraceae bacterium]